MIGAWEIISLGIIILIVYLLGNDAPKLARQTGKGINSFKQAKEIPKQVKEEIKKIKE
ncbi:MAG: hypothetical protein ACMXX9_01430 [Candidatus Woesearchaeota archaeon]